MTTKVNPPIFFCLNNLSLFKRKKRQKYSSKTEKIIFFKKNRVTPLGATLLRYKLFFGFGFFGIKIVIFTGGFFR